MGTKKPLEGEVFYPSKEVIKQAKRRIVCELNLGQFATYLRSWFSGYEYLQYNKVQGLPFMISELKQKFREILENKNV